MIIKDIKVGQIVQHKLTGDRLIVLKIAELNTPASYPITCRNMQGAKLDYKVEELAKAKEI